MKKFEDALLDVSLHNLTVAANKHSNIDNKAIAIITISGFLISLLAGGTISITCGTLGSPYIISKSLFMLCMVSFFVTVWMSTKAIKPRDTEELSTDDLIKHLSEEDPERQIKGTIGTIARVEDTHLNICDEKAKQLWNAIKALQASILLMSVYAVTVFFQI